MGVCGENVKKREERDKKKREKRETESKARILETKRKIMGIESNIDMLEKEIKSMKEEIESPTGEGTNELKLNEKKNDLIAKIKQYKSLLKHRRVLKNNLETMEKKINENNIVDVLEDNNKILNNANDGSAQIIGKNTSNLKEQNDQMDENEKLFEEGDGLIRGNLNKYEIDAEINGFFKEMK